MQKKFTLCAVILCVITAAIIRNLSFTNPYLAAIGCLLRLFIYIGLYSTWAFSFQKRMIQKKYTPLSELYCGTDEFLDVSETVLYIRHEA